jgi:hypothetical protein
MIQTGRKNIEKMWIQRDGVTENETQINRGTERRRKINRQKKRERHVE